jgi:hypothetical protein
LPDTTHEGLITSEAGAEASAQAIMDVIASIRTGEAMPGS